MVDMPQFPETITGFEELFVTDADCARYLVGLRWPAGYLCPSCGCAKTWMTAVWVLTCSKCRHRKSIVAGTLMDPTHYPLKTWFRVAWHVCEQKNGISALGLQRAMGFGSYHTAWQWLQRMRRAMVLPSKIYSKELVELVFTQPYCKIQFLVDSGIAQRQTASEYLQELEKIGILKGEKRGREVFYKHPALLKVLAA
jgi:hypothetical protein